MAITAYGFDGSINEAQWSQLWADAMLVAPSREGVVSGLAVTPAAGTRKVSVATGRAVGPGVGAVSDAAVELTFDAVGAAQARIDVPVVEFDWTANTATIKVVKGTAAGGDAQVAPTLTRTWGVKWQVPLGTVELHVGDSTVTAAMIEPSASRPDTGWMPVDPAGGWTDAPTPLAVRKVNNRITLSGQFKRSGGNLAIGAQHTFGGIALVPLGLRPSRKVSGLAIWEIASTPRFGAFELDSNGQGLLVPQSASLATGHTARIHITWEV